MSKLNSKQKMQIYAASQNTKLLWTVYHEILHLMCSSGKIALTAHHASVSIPNSAHGSFKNYKTSVLHQQVCITSK